MARAKIYGTGSALPRQLVTNEALADWFDPGVAKWAEVIEISTRYWSANPVDGRLIAGESNEYLATIAARRAIDNARISPDQIDLLIVATLTPDNPVPPMALQMRQTLGIPPGRVLQLNAGCSGLAQAVGIATAFMATSDVEFALIVGSDVVSRFIPRLNARRLDHATVRAEAREIAISFAMFGDGAGAMILGPTSPGEIGILGSMFKAASTGRRPAITLSEEDVPNQATPVPILHHNAQDVLTQGPALIRDAKQWVESQFDLGEDRVDFYVPPQANGRLIATASREFNSPAKVYANVSRVGNTSSASIYIALDELNRGGLLHPGHHLVLFPTEAAWSYGAVPFRWERIDGGVTTSGVTP